MSDLISKDSVLGIIESKCVDGCLEAGGVTLIDAYGLIDEISYLPNFDNEKLNEREIRNKSIEEFAEKVKNLIVNYTYPYFDKEGKPVSIWNADGYKCIDNLLKEIAEQMKEVGE